MIGALRAGINPAGDAVLQHERRSVGGSRYVRMDVEQAGDDELATRIDRVGGISRDAGVDRRDAACGNSDVSDGIESR